MKLTRRHALAVIAAAAASAALPARAAPEADPWDFWAAHDPASRRVVDHGLWQRFLDRFVVAVPGGPNLVRYDAVDAPGRKLLDDAIARYTGLAVRRLNRREQRAVWIDLYNALTVRVVLDHYPVATIRDIDISPGWFADGPWGAKLIAVEGQRLSLDDIEHRILRPFWKDARLHYALNCAALGCPPLQTEAFTGINGERPLNDAAAAFVNSPDGVWFDGDTLRVSSIYRWYAADFGGWPDGVIRHLVGHAGPRLAARLAMREVIGGHDYDWRLNDAGSTGR